MAVVTGEVDGELTLFVAGKDPVEGLTEHDLRLLEFALAQRRALSRRCEARDGIHVCGVFPGHPVVAGHGIGHLCQGCAYRWAAGNGDLPPAGTRMR